MRASPWSSQGACTELVTPVAAEVPGHHFQPRDRIDCASWLGRTLSKRNSGAVPGRCGEMRSRRRRRHRALHGCRRRGARGDSPCAARRRPSVRMKRSVSSAPRPSTSDRRPAPMRRFISSYPQPVLRVHEAERELRVVLRGGKDVRHAVGIAQDLHRRVDSGDRFSPSRWGSDWRDKRIRGGRLPLPKRARKANRRKQLRTPQDTPRARTITMRHRRSSVITGSMLYSLYEAQHLALVPLRYLAELARGWFGHPFSPLAHHPMSRRFAASSDRLPALTDRYEKPRWNLHEARPEVVRQAVLPADPLSAGSCPAAQGARRGAALRHLATLLRDTVRTLLVDHEVWVTTGSIARMVPLTQGRSTSTTTSTTCTSGSASSRRTLT